MQIELPFNPDFTFVQDDLDRVMIQTAYKAVCDIGGWSVIVKFDEESFMFSKNTNVQSIMNKVSEYYPHHSGTSMGCIMRVLQFISKNGFDKYRSEYIKEKEREYREKTTAQKIYMSKDEEYASRGRENILEFIDTIDPLKINIP